MTAFYGTFDRQEAEEESINTIGKALESGINFLDTAWIYQSFGIDGKENVTNEDLVGKAIARFGRENFIIATKGGIRRENGALKVDGSIENFKVQIEESLNRLKIDYIDLYYIHRIDINIPIEDTIRFLKTYVDQGKIKYIGLSECTPDELRRAHAIHPITAIQMEWSLQSRDIENTLVPVARELGVGIVAYSPLGRGFLGDIKKVIDEIEAAKKESKSDSRIYLPRFSGENFEKNKENILKFYELAAQKNCTPSQLALAWLHSQGDDVFPIPGTKNSNHIISNAKAFDFVPLSAEDKVLVENLVKCEGERFGNSFNHYNTRL